MLLGVAVLNYSAANSRNDNATFQTLMLCACEDDHNLLRDPPRQN